MNKVSQFTRVIYIYYVLSKHGLDEIILAMPWFAPIRFLSYVNPWYWMRNRKLPRGQRLREALEDLGPIFVKFGQMLSTRRDFIPDDIALELAALQDSVRPFANAQAILMKRLDMPEATMLSNFINIPLASASIAQVHAATLPNGDDVVVKIKRPGIDKLIRRDIALMRTLAEWAERYTLAGRRLRAKDLVSEFEHTLLDELDLLREAANASILKRNFTHSSMLYIPEIHWPYCRADVLVMERIYGIPVAKTQELQKQGADLKVLAENCIHIFFTQVFRDCFFHADLHPGNLFVDASIPSQPKVIAVDFGIMGTLSPRDQRYLAENMLAFFKRDYRRVAELHLESGWIPSDTRLGEFELAIAAVCEPIFEKPLKDISFGQLLLRLFQTGKRFHMEVQPQLLLLQKTLLNVEGLARQLYPDLDLWGTAKPFLEKWLKTQVGPKALIRKLREYAPIWAERLPELPNIWFRQAQVGVMSPVMPSHYPPVAQQHETFKKRRVSRFWQGLWVGVAFVALSGLAWLTQAWHMPLNPESSLLFVAILAYILLLLSLVRR